MEIIKKISGYVDEELHDAEKYIKCALKHKEEYPAFAKTLYQLSEEEMDHANRLHDIGVNMISNYRSENGEPPKEMQIIYDYEHEKQIEMAKGIRVMQSMYKGT